MYTNIVLAINPFFVTAFPEIGNYHLKQSLLTHHEAHEEHEVNILISSLLLHLLHVLHGKTCFFARRAL